MPKPRLQDALETLAMAVTNALNLGDVETPGQVGIGWPIASELVSILNNGQYQVTVYDRGKSARNAVRYPGAPMFPISSQSTPLEVAIAKPTSAGSPWTMTFSGSLMPNLNVHTFVGSPLRDARVSSTSTDTLMSIATKVAAAVNALDVAGVVATASEATVSITGTPIAVCNVVGTGGVLAQEINRIARTFQVSVWAPNPAVRDQATDAIETWVTTAIAPFLTLSDGTPMLCLLLPTKGEFERSDDAQSSYSAYVDHVLFEIEYGVLRTYPGYVIGAVEQLISAGAAPAIVDVINGA